MARKRAVRVERELGLDGEIARLVVAEERLLALAGPFHRPADAARRPGDQRELRIDRAARAEIAADVAHRRRAPDRPARRGSRRDRSSVAPRRRCRRGACSAGSPHRSRPTAARGSIGTPVTRWTQVSSFTTCAARANAASVAARVADLGVDADVGGGSVPERGASGSAAATACGHRRQRLVVDHDRARRRPSRRRTRLGDHHGDRLADDSAPCRRQAG